MANFYFSAGLEIRAAVATRTRPAGGLALEATAVWRTASPAAEAASSTHIIFAREGLLPDGNPCELMVGNSGLLGADWGTVLDTSENQQIEVQVESDDWGNVAAVGLVAENSQVSVRVRMLRSKPLPRIGRLFRFRGRNYVVLGVQRVTASRAVREFTVNGGRWEDLGGQQTVPVPDTLAGWTG